MPSALPRDLPPGINAFDVPHAVNTHALDFPLRHTAPGMTVSFSADIPCTILDSKLKSTMVHSRGRRNYQLAPLDDLQEVQEY